MFPTAGAVSRESVSGAAAVAIDVLRATTTIAAALMSGASAVEPFLEPDHARARRAAMGPSAPLLGGERHSVLIPGFDLGNSPLEYTPEAVAGKTVLLTTTNGTRCIHAAADAHVLYTAAFVNAGTTAAALAAAGRDVVICCAGTRERFSLEDTACAGALVDRLLELHPDAAVDDLGRTARLLYRHYAGRLADVFADSEHGRSLLELGLAADLAYCARLDSVPVLAQYAEGRIRRVA